MEYRVAELAEAAGVGVDTVRFYQARGLIPPPTRRGRFAIYSRQHLECLRRIRSLLDSGFSLAQIRHLLERDGPQVATDGGSPARADAGWTSPRRRVGVEPSTEERSLLQSLADRSVGDGTLSRAELAAQTGVPEALIGSSIQAGLITPVEIHGEERFPRSDLEMLRAALAILGMGLPLDRLLELGAQHAAHVDRLVEQAIDLFDDSIRKPRGEDDEGVRRVFERLLPKATEIVALHFQRTVVTRALARLRASGDARALEEALEMTRASRLEVQWR
jgi:DNA-binding transcriptional MerR regulator